MKGPIPELKQRVREAKKKLASEMENFHGEWVAIDLKTETILYHSASRQELMASLKSYGREDLYYQYVD